MGQGGRDGFGWVGLSVAAVAVVVVGCSKLIVQKSRNRFR